MPDDSGRRRPHFILEGFVSTERFQSPQSGARPRTVPMRDRHTHGAALLDQIAGLSPTATTPQQAAEDLDAEPRLILEFVGFADIDLAFESLPRERSGIELLNVRREGEITYATVSVPAGKLTHFEKIIEDYLSERRAVNGRALDNRRLVDTIKKIRAGSLRALWTDDLEFFPANERERIWWEVWLPVRGDRAAVLGAFRSLAAAQEIRVPPAEVHFPERTVVLAFGSQAQMTRSVALLNLIAELRRAKETAEFFDSLLPEEQHEWLADLLGRTRFNAGEPDTPHVCLLDTGVNNGHPLLAPALENVDLHTVEPAWGTADADGHGTSMAGIALLGDLTRVLDGDGPVDVHHRLESVKLLPFDGANQGDPQLHGYVTIEGVARPEITAPARARVFVLAVTSRDARDRGRPSAWSAAIDGLAADADGEGANPRLLIVSAGNVSDPSALAESPASNSSDGIHDPGQAWNALTVGAYTDLVRITEPDAGHYQPVALAGAISPFSTTSATWQAQWPLKPDVVLEGGNAANDGMGAVPMPSLSLLTTHHRPVERLFTTTNATSAASGLAAGMAAELMAAYPRLRPESIRALIVQSAGWTDEMRRNFLPQGRAPTKSDYAKLIRHCGFGVPDLARARWSASNSLALIVEEELYPFARDGSADPTLRDMHLHELPWPMEELEQLRDTTVEMRVTLSYFIEPNPSARGHGGRYRYESHALRFDVRRPTESTPDFRRRINRAARAEEEGTRVSSDDSQWLIGTQARHRGSLHSDIWRGTAADLASRGMLAIYPALGWWKTRTGLRQYDRVAPYTLVVSIHAPAMDVDLYTPVATQIAARVAVNV